MWWLDRSTVPCPQGKEYRQMTNRPLDWSGVPCRPLNGEGSLQYAEAQGVCWYQSGPSHCAKHWKPEDSGLRL
ncbi:hypothetical protein KUCAC02_024313 [Chaenocephalus aceratus]|uniref:Uncharacterized protein n=1 Tax=Chaenocephalus aceratus TaxID=36190 RepID=A0ACB9WJ57_CHAAC|nr:hypothetical protein KUCAC02_024313 [Chaenocephalus aceratus]